MKQFISWMGKRVAGGIVTAVFFVLAVLGIVYAAVSFPTTGPGGIDAGGQFMTYFNNMFAGCSGNQVIKSFTSSGIPVCVNGGSVSAINCSSSAPPNTPISFACMQCMTAGGTLQDDGSCIKIFWDSNNVGQGGGAALSASAWVGPNWCPVHPDSDNAKAICTSKWYTYVSHTTSIGIAGPCGQWYSTTQWDGSAWSCAWHITCNSNYTWITSVKCKMF